MIPKVIHYCWFGNQPLPETYKNYIRGWEKLCPDYIIKRWDESNFDLNSCSFVKEAYEAKKWAFVSDYARLKIIYDEGGVYLDTDVELIKNLDCFLMDKCFLAEESSGYINTGLGFGSEKRNPIIKAMLSKYENHFLLENGTYDMTPCPIKNTEAMFDFGYKYSGQSIWSNNLVVVYPPSYFCPINYETGEVLQTDNTVSIHHYAAEWHTKNEKRIALISRKCIMLFGRKYGKMVSMIAILPFAFLNIVEKEGIKNTPIYLLKKLNKIHKVNI